MKIYLERHWLDEPHDRLTVFFGNKHSIDYVPAQAGGSSDVDARDRLRAALALLTEELRLERDAKEVFRRELAKVRGQLELAANASEKRNLVDERSADDGTISELCMQLEKAHFQRNRAFRNLNEGIAEWEGIRAENRVLIDRLKASVRARDGLIKAIIEVRAELKRLRAETEESKLMRELKEARASEAVARAEAQHAKEFMTQARHSAREAEDERELARSGWRSAIGTMNKAIGQLDELMHEIETRNQRIVELEWELSAKSTRIRDLESELTKRGAVAVIGDPEFIPRALTADEVNARYEESVRRATKQASGADCSPSTDARPMSAREFEAMLEPVGAEDPGWRP